MLCRGVRGATTVEKNDKDEILDATHELVSKVIRDNGILSKDVASVIFSMTGDLDAVFPSIAVRKFSWADVPIFCTQEMDVQDGLQRCIRLLIHWNTHKSQSEIKHVYLRRAVDLRPDLKRT